MGASFAKSVCKSRGAKAREASPEEEWSLGWVFPIKTDSVPAAEGWSEGPGSDPDSPPCLLPAAANTEDRS